MRESYVQRGYVEGCRTHPAVALSYDDFSRHCARALVTHDGSEWLQHGAELFLCAGCTFGDRQALESFEQQVLPAAREAIARINDQAAFVAEALASLRRKLLDPPYPKVSEYTARGSLVAWTRVVATRHALDRLEAPSRKQSTEGQLTRWLMQGQGAAAALGASQRYARLLERAVSGAVRELPARERNVLRMHLLGRCDVDQIGRAYSVRRATAARWLSITKLRLSQAVREQLRNQDAGIADDEQETLVSFMLSQLELPQALTKSETGRASSSSN